MRSFLILNVLLFEVFLAAGITAQGAEIGIINELKGTVSIRHANATTAPATQGLKLNLDDMVITGEASVAKLIMVDGNIFVVSEKSEMHLQEYPEGNGATTIHLKGSVSAQIHRKYDDVDSSFRLVTPNAVAGVRGTEFSLEEVNGQTRFTTFEGVVDIGEKMVGRQIENPLRLEKGQQVSMEAGHLKRNDVRKISEPELKKIKPNFSKAPPLAKSKNEKPDKPADKKPKNK